MTRGTKSSRYFRTSSRTAIAPLASTSESSLLIAIDFPLLSSFIELAKRLVVLTAVEHTDDRHEILLGREGDGDAPAESDCPQTRPQVVASCAALRKGIESLA